MYRTSSEHLQGHYGNDGGNCSKNKSAEHSVKEPGHDTVGISVLIAVQPSAFVRGQLGALESFAMRVHGRYLARAQNGS